MDYESHIWAKGKINLGAKNASSLNLLRLIEIFKKITPRPLNILEIGCGGGANIATLKDVFPDSQYHAIDISKNGIKKAKEVDHNINYIVCDAHSLCFEKNSFDLVRYIKLFKETLQWLIIALIIV